jgi:hypothetical protein
MVGALPWRRPRWRWRRLPVLRLPAPAGPAELSAVGYIGAATLTALGAFFQVSGTRRVKRIVGEFEARLAEAEQRLADEDAAMEEAYAAEGAGDEGHGPSSQTASEHEADAAHPARLPRRPARSRPTPCRKRRKR